MKSKRLLNSDDKRGDWGSLEEEEEFSDAKESNMATSEAGENTDMTENLSTEPHLTEITEMLANIQTSIANILQENKSVKTELTELKAAYQEQKHELESVKTFLKSTKIENLLLREELKHTEKKLTESIETDSLNEELNNLEQHTRKNSLEIHGVPEDAYTSTKEVVLKLPEVLINYICHWMRFITLWNFPFYYYSLTHSISSKF